MADKPRSRRSSSAAVLGLLSEEVRTGGRLVDEQPTAQPEGASSDAGEQQPDTAPPESPTPSRPARTSTPARQPRREEKRAAQTPPDKDSPVVSQTVRVHGPAAKTLRDAWLDERRRGDVLLSYTDFATRVVLAGLQALDHENR